MPERAAVLGIFLFVLCGPTAARADDQQHYEELYGWDVPRKNTRGISPDEVHIQGTLWDFGLRFGKASPTQGHQTIEANNSAFLVSDPGSPGEDEFAENGLPSPNFQGKTVLQGDRGTSYALGAQFYYKVAPWVSLGVEATYTTREDMSTTFAGPFSAPIYSTVWRASSFQPVAAVRIGDWIRSFRPYVMFGYGPYYLWQKVTSELKDADDPDHPPVVAADTVDRFGSILWGGGLDIRFFGEGSVGVSVQGQQVNYSSQDLIFVVTSLHLTYHF